MITPEKANEIANTMISNLKEAQAVNIECPTLGEMFFVIICLIEKIHGAWTTDPDLIKEWTPTFLKFLNFIGQFRE